MAFSLFERSFGSVFSIMSSLVMIVFVIAFGLIIYRVIQGAAQWSRNNSSPVLSVDARVVAKRMDVSHHHHSTGDLATKHYSSSTTYFATFEMESGDRLELRLPDREYGMLAEGDYGKLTFQGTRYKSFARDKA